MSNWLGEAISQRQINYYEYSSFKNVQEVGKGAFGSVSSAWWESRGIKVALKTLINDCGDSDPKNEKFLKELLLLTKVNYHPNINQFLGLTEDVDGKFILILQYADQGNMRQYLEKNFKSLLFPDKIRMAKDIARGLRCLHEEGIIHRDLHSKNVLVHEGRMIIADLGLGKELDKVPITSASDVQGMPAYVEPQVFRNTKYKRDKRSDIYSLGVLLWEISSGVPPFKGTLPQSIPIIIYNGTRELPVIGTPSAYVELYTKCWSDNPKDRPDIVEVIDFLDEVPPDSDIKSSQPTIKVIESDSRSMNIKQEDTRLTNFSSSASASFLQVNRGSSLNISENWNHIQLSNDALGIDKKDNPMRNADSSKNLDSKEYRKSVISNLSKEIFELQLICTRKGSRKSWKDMITWIENNKSNAREIFEFFNNNDFLHREVILGNFHSIGFGTERNLHEAFRCFIKASKGGDRLGDYEVALCYEKGIGVTKDIAKAIYFYEKVSSTEIDGENSHDDGVVNAKYMLGMIYSNNDVGDKKMDALKLVKSAAEGGYAPAQHYLSQYYQSRDLEKALEWADRCEKNGGWK